MIVRSFASVATVALVATIVSGCSGVDGVELNGKMFDWMGVSEAAKKANAREPRLPSRAGLVMPPDVNRLPEPGSETNPNDATVALADPDKKKALAAAERERLHKAYCSGEMDWKERTRTRASEQDAPKSPYGPCSILGGMAKQAVD